MKIYLVGGAVRDELLNLPIKERDYVVVGATVEEMLSLGFKQVGKDFPVFLHPKTKEEYALARVERKVSKGYTGFAFDVSPQVSLEEDLKRRDITINAMAIPLNDHGVIESFSAADVNDDPYHGKIDLQKKLLRHVSAAFSEDPVRILRVARFAARFAELGFTVAPETMDLMREMVSAGEVDALVAERVWKELERALGEKNPEKFFQVLEDCGAASILFLFAEKEQSLNRSHGSEKTQHIFALDALINAVELTTDPRIRFAALLHHQTLDYIGAFCERYRVPSDYRELAELLVRYFKDCQAADSAEKMLSLFQVTDAFRREERFKSFLLACKASCLPGEIAGFQEWSTKLIYCLEAAKKINVSEYVQAGLPGKEIASKLAEKRRELIQGCCEKKLRN